MSDKKKQKQSAEVRSTRRFDAFMAVTIDSLTSLFNNNPAQAAAAIAYYFLFSIFPLFLFIVIVLSYFLDTGFVQEKMVQFVQELIPGAEVLIKENLQNILANRGSTSILATVSLLWSGSGMINGIISNVQRAFPETNTRGYFINRALAIAIILLVIILIALVLIFSFVFNISDALAYFNVSLTKPLSTIINIVTTYVLPIFFLYIVGFVLYYAIPTAKVERSAARIAALLFAVVWRAFSIIFGKYVLSPMNRYSLVYGSVTVIVLLLLFIYFTAFIILYPAHLAAAITHYKQRRAGILAAAPINPESIKPKAPQRGKKKKSTQNSVNSRTLSDPVYLDPNVGQAPQTSVWQQIWEIIKGLFRWK
ncbi:MAG: YihY/virulence factor BrkB family protein [Anaerolineaceae bacterium]|nr:YihY/virulence factor BrkB family protein [Anaerolineaceae bacterium]